MEWIVVANIVTVKGPSADFKCEHKMSSMIARNLQVESNGK